MQSMLPMEQVKIALYDDFFNLLLLVLAIDHPLQESVAYKRTYAGMPMHEPTMADFLIPHGFVDKLRR